jgi:hypothetical protein
VDPAAAKCPRTRHGGTDDVGQLRRGLDGSLSPGSHDRARDASRVGLLAVPPEDVDQGGLIVGGHHFRGGHATRGVETHVERVTGLEAEAAVVVVKLL